MGNSIPAYRRNLDGLTVLLVAAQGVLPLVLGYALAGWELATVFVVAVTLVGLWRTGGTGALPGTYRLAPHQAPGLFHLVNSLAGQAGLRRRPELRIVPGGQTNAAATLNGNTPVLVVTEALLSRLDSRRLAAVLAHEVAHLAHGDLVLFRLAHSYQAATVVLGTLTVVLALVTVAFAPAVSLFWAVVAALAPAASRFLVAALSLTGDPGALADALEFIDYRPRTLWDWLTGSRSPVPDPASNAFRTHPPTVERVRRLDRMARFSD